MNKIIFSLATITAISIGFASQAQAGPRGHSGSASFARSGSVQRSYATNNYVRSNSYINPGRYSSFNGNYGTRFSNGYYYGRGYNSWSCSRYDTRYGCTCYFDPCYSCWYYWCEPDCCYYPVTYCPYSTYCW